MTIRYLLLCLILAVVVALFTWTSMSYHPSNMTSASQQVLPDAYMEIVTAVMLDKQGKPSIKIETPKLVHYADNDTSELTDPQLTIYRKSPQPWFITSRFAKATQGIKHVDFWNDVTIHHAGDLTSPATVIKTPTLTVHPIAQTAETAALITLIQPNIIVKATGMNADMTSGSIKLLSEARGEYVPS